MCALIMLKGNEQTAYLPRIWGNFLLKKLQAWSLMLCDNLTPKIIPRPLASLDKKWALEAVNDILLNAILKFGFAG